MIAKIKDLTTVPPQWCLTIYRVRSVSVYEDGTTIRSRDGVKMFYGRDEFAVELGNEEEI